ncbi:hypothetical protein HerbRD11066_67560 [Herbidospora sp. RD11066]
MSSARIEVLRQEARSAWASSASTYTPRLGSEAEEWSHGSVAWWGAGIDAVEKAGWVLRFWEVTSNEIGVHTAFPVFRRS